MAEKIKVVWICHFSNELIRKHLSFDTSSIWYLVQKLLKKLPYYDYAVWNTNGIKEFEKYSKEVELYVISPHKGLAKDVRFECKGINYFFFKSEDDNLFDQLLQRITHRIGCGEYRKNALKICNEIDSINPDIVHLIGAENPYYSNSILYLNDSNYITIAQLQTLLADPSLLNAYSDKGLRLRAKSEANVIKKAQYCGTCIAKYRDIVRLMKPDARFLDTKLAVGVSISIPDIQKKYTFVYFANDVSKAADLAVDGFIEAFKDDKTITLEIIGRCHSEFRSSLEEKLSTFGAIEAVHFKGFQPAYSDVLSLVDQAKFALLPLKADIVSSTIREAMAHGLPVVTTITEGGTLMLNEKRESVLLSDIGDNKALAANMLKLCKDESFANRIRENAFLTVEELYSNKAAMENYYKAYRQVLIDRKEARR